MNVEGQVSSYAHRYRSKVDSWLAAVLIGALLITLITTLSVLLLPGAFAAAWWSVIIVVVAWGFVLTLLFPLYYEITPTTLLIRSGWTRRVIPLDSIQQVFPARNPSSAPALSLDRLQVDYSRGNLRRYVLISPRDKVDFLRDLAASAGDLELQGDRLIRR